MLKNNLKYFLLLALFVMISCAKRGTITGGLKDTLAPTLKMSFPKNYSTNFKGDEIKLVFDENIKLKNLNKQLIISPPMKQEPIISPTTASKFLNIKIKDTLQPNTTYSFNFGQSIADNNEGNPYNQFKYVFSTGDYIDSLAIGGKIKDAYEKEADAFVSVMLYEVNEKYNDSVVYNDSPRYITNTLDSLKTFKLENLKAGKYLLVAMKDNNSNNKFNPKEDKIGFRKKFINIPNDTVYELELFKETLDFKSYKPSQASGNRLLLGYNGKQNLKENQPKIVVKNNTQNLESIITQMPKKDSLQIWFKPLKADSLAVSVSRESYIQDYIVKIKDQKKDTLNITALQNGNINFRERFTLETATPLVKFDDSKIKLIVNDSTEVPFKREYDVFNQKIYLDFDKEPNQKYNFSLLPGALTDFYEKSNDTLSYKLSTKNEDEFGNLRIQLQNVKYFPVIVELTDAKGDVLASEYTDFKTIVDFNLLNPAVYSLRITYDENKNKQYDPGSFLEKRYSEEVVYFSKEIDVRANWDVDQVFDVSIPYTPEPKENKKKEKPQKKQGF
ncbi:Ig-like domain-containing protein [Flavobacterium degerlachei]|jgi:outer membrane lipoprotein-sorting protein|uniref:Ig-like domain-containing protein n=1 Tax=Flavobacterium degerlachei TaxID=229203 RepID=A0A1H3CYU4_9FLAO|nr:Ig-like domain-containing protein [Flavobacterium degerlachei]SDX58714.1 Ig-like domain-containing protein [Flavobacterium degerlachei]